MRHLAGASHAGARVETHAGDAELPDGLGWHLGTAIRPEHTPVNGCEEQVMGQSRRPLDREIALQRMGSRDVLDQLREKVELRLHGPREIGGPALGQANLVARERPGDRSPRLGRQLHQRLDEGLEAQQRIAMLLDAFPEPWHGLTRDHGLRDGDEEVLLAREVLVEGADGHLRALDDVLDGEVGRGLLLQESCGGRHETVAPRMGTGTSRSQGPIHALTLPYRNGLVLELPRRFHRSSARRHLENYIVLNWQW